MRDRRRPPPFLVVLIYAAIVAVVSLLVVTLRFTVSLLFLFAVPAVLSAFYYERTAYVSMHAILAAASICVTSLRPGAFGSSLTIIAFSVPAAFGMAEVIHRLISSRQRAEKALRESERFLQRIMDTVFNSVWVKDREGRFVRANHNFASLYGLTPEAIVGMTERDLAARAGYDLEKADRFMAEDRQVTETQRPQRVPEITVSLPNGETKWFEVIKAPLTLEGTPGYVLGVSMDITELKRAENALRESEERYTRLFNRVPVGLYRTTPEGRALDANPALVKMLGFPDRATLIATVSSDTYLDAQDRARWRALVDREGLVSDFEVQMRRYDGTSIWVRDAAQAIRDDQGRVLHYEGSLADITARKAAEEALRESESKLRTIIEQSNDGILLADEHRVIVEWNRAQEQITGLSRQEVLGQPMSDVLRRLASSEEIDQGWPRPTGSGVGDVTSAGRAAPLGRYEQREIRRPDGTTRIVESQRFTAGTEMGFMVGSVTRDVTERVRLEQQLREVQKMEALGRLAGGVAHEFNNLLTVISGYSEFVLTGLPATHAVREDVETIRAAGDRAADLTRQLLAFGRRQVLKTEVLDLNQIIEGMARLLRRILGEDITLKVSLAEDLSSIRADAGQMQDVIVNLAANARDAMPTGGLLSVETSNV